MSNKTDDIINKVKTKAVAAGQVAAHAADVTVQKAGKLVESTKLTFKIYELTGEVNELKKKAGEMLYAAHRGEETDHDALEDIFAEIDAKLALIGELKARRQEGQSSAE